MRVRSAVCYISLAVVVCTGGCSGKNTHEGVMRDGIALMKEMADVLSGITDKASAEAAKPKLEKLGERMAELQKRQNALGPPSKEETERLVKKFEPEMKPIIEKMMQSQMKLMQNPEAQKAIQESMAKMMQGAMANMPKPSGKP